VQLIHPADQIAAARIAADNARRDEPATQGRLSEAEREP
jgi:hypothetical protein